MGKLIAVWGSPGSGKATFSVKLAEALNSRSKKSAGHKTLVVFTDLTSPVVPVVFPNIKRKRMKQRHLMVSLLLMMK